MVQTRSQETNRSGRPKRSAVKEAENSSRERRARRDLWDGERRFSWTAETEAHMYQGGKVDRASGVTIYKCKKTENYYPRKGDLKAYKKHHPDCEDYISIDHKENYRDYIQGNARGHEITVEAAREAYNDIDNLRLVCQKKNSSMGNR